MLKSLIFIINSNSGIFLFLFLSHLSRAGFHIISTLSLQQVSLFYIYLAEAGYHTFHSMLIPLLKMYL